MHVLRKEEVGKLFQIIQVKDEKSNYQVKGYEKETILIIIKNFKNAQQLFQTTSRDNKDVLRTCTTNCSNALW